MSPRPAEFAARARKLARALPPERLHPAAAAWAASRPPGERWGVAFSGGADSLCLLLLLWSHCPGRRGGLRALHFDHRLRGARAAAADARFCRSVCRALGIPLIAGAWKKAHRSASEAEAREARLAFFSRAMRAHRLGALWLGHQQDDIAETLLMRLARGSGTAGLAAPRPVQQGPSGRPHVRPLLDLKKAEITAALKAAGLPWREDATNSGEAYFRNRIRRSVLPAWVRAAGRDALAGTAVSRSLLEEDDRALEAWVDSLRCLTPAGKLDLGRLRGQPRAVARRALHRWLRVQPGPPELSRRGFAALLDSAMEGAPTRHSLAGGFAVLRGKWLRFERPD